MFCFEESAYNKLANVPVENKKEEKKNKESKPPAEKQQKKKAKDDDEQMDIADEAVASQPKFT